jgi:hypothetical protein
MRCLFCVIMLLAGFCASGQLQGDFKFGDAGPNDFVPTYYNKDSSTRAIVLDEFGSASLNLGSSPEIAFYHHVRIKILNKNGFDKANVVISLQKFKEESEQIEDIIASTFNMEETGIRETKLHKDAIIHERTSEYLDQIKFVLPDIQEGAVVEYSYKIISPFVRTFHSWEFQADVPKIRSEYWTRIPEQFDYHVIFKGYYPIRAKETVSQPNCQKINGSPVNCLLTKYLMVNLPAFYDEEYMTSRKNFLSAIYFELKNTRRPLEPKPDLAKEWENLEQELKHHKYFGAELRINRSNFWKANLPDSIRNEHDTLKKAKKTDTFIKNHFVCNDLFGIFTLSGIRMAFRKSEGNAAEINLALVSALRHLGIRADPVILSSRTHGFVSKSFPVLSEFNYVIAQCTIQGQTYMLDATEKPLAFGMVPPRCLNGPGRLFNAKFKSMWVDIPYYKNNKTESIVSLTLNGNGQLSGNLTQRFYGYDGYEKRKEILQYYDLQKYLKSNQMHDIKIARQNMTGLYDKEELLKIFQEVEVQSDDSTAENILVNPFLNYRFVENPFKAKTRLHPIDFAYPSVWYFESTITIPENFDVVSLPDSCNFTLPRQTASYVYSAEWRNGKIFVSSLLCINKTSFVSSEYHQLKALFAAVIRSHNEEVIIKRKE